MKKGIILLIALLLIGGGAGGYAIYTNNQEQLRLAEEQARLRAVEEALLSYHEGIAAEDFEGMYAALTEGSRAAISQEDFVAKNRNIYSGIEAASIAVELLGIAENGEDRAYASYHLQMDTLAGALSFSGEAVLVGGAEEGYLLEWTPAMIFPSLAWEDRVRVNTLAAERGSIYDRRGEMLAGEGVASSIGLVPGKMTEQSDLELLSELLGLTVERIEKSLGASYVKEDTFVALKTVPKHHYALKEELLTVPGIKIIDVPVRYYPLGEEAAHLIGYVQSINAEELEERAGEGYNANSILGKAGLEQIYEERLRAVDGKEIVILDAAGEVKQVLAKKEKRDGEDITLTIDARLQQALYAQFSEDKGCSVAMDPHTGEVLALVSTPTYNANDFVLGMPQATWEALRDDENLPMYNRFKAALCPGSTFKAVTAGVGLTTNTVTAAEDFGHSGLRWRKDESWGGYYIATTQEYDEAANVENALVYSDNIYFGKLALRMGAEFFAEELIRLGFEERIPFEYGLYSSIVSRTESFTSEIQLADSGFGQGELLVNPVHLAALYAAFLHGGDMLRPRLLLRDDPPEMWVEGAFSPEAADAVLEGLEQVILRGTGKEGAIAGLSLAGKTGTAEIKQSKDDEDGTELGWFVMTTLGEVERPLLIVSMVEDVKERGGSHYVIPGVRAVFEQVLFDALPFSVKES